ncbi:hypothetical protein BBK82_37950 [Lentzea guizhouensis]|uniref:Transcriptional regulator LacI/GalR-like sensor domain-containing protein n=1 Tax=Lentzea guizhouensis TaxID=1586287 RepID=A0A1B2I075_9PSEU|nr:hypothetical protein BBK82_37950 [Lentzea guizhouensis]
MINGHRDVSARTRKLVEEIVVREGYVRPGSIVAKGVVRRGTMVELIINEVDNAWAAEILGGVERVLREHGAQVVLTAVHSTREPDDDWLDLMVRRGSRGVILVYSDLTSSQRAALSSRSVPFVVVDPVGSPVSDVHTVTATNWHGGLAATQHLLSLGHRRIGVIGGPENSPCSNARIAGYRSALRLAGVATDSALVRHGDFGYEQGRLQTDALLDLPVPPTAIFAANDLQALGAYEALRDRRLHIPEDISVVGFDDVPFAAWTSPPLTTVKQPLRRMGVLAAQTLVCLMRGEQVESPRTRMATNLVVRGSTSVAKSASRAEGA